VDGGGAYALADPFLDLFLMRKAKGLPGGVGLTHLLPPRRVPSRENNEMMYVPHNSRPKNAE
jgi:hypothetical protein